MNAEKTLLVTAAERILVLDGAMGTMIQELKLDEGGYRGARFDAWNREVRGNNDLLILTQPARSAWTRTCWSRRYRRQRGNIRDGFCGLRPAA